MTDREKRIDNIVKGLNVMLEEKSVTENRVKALIEACFNKGQGGWNEEEDREVYLRDMMEFAKIIGLVEN